MNIQMLDTFLTGHPVIDGEHKQIVNAINAVSAAIEAGDYDHCSTLLTSF